MLQILRAVLCEGVVETVVEVEVEEEEAEERHLVFVGLDRA